MRNSGKRGGGAVDPSDQQAQVMSPSLPHSTVPVQNFCNVLSSNPYMFYFAYKELVELVEHCEVE